MQRKFKQMGHVDVPAKFKAANKSAAEIVAQAASAKVPVRTGKLKASIRALGQARQGLVKMGKAKILYAGWIEFGGNIKRGTIRRTFIKSGRYLYPALKQNSSRIRVLYERQVLEAIREFENGN